MKLTITIKGDSEDDLLLALDEVRRLVASGFSAGLDHNSTGSYEFIVSGTGEASAPQARSRGV